METSSFDAEMKHLGGLPAVRRWMERYRERKTWEAAHPELATAWNAALEEDDVRTKARELAQKQTEAAHGAPATLARLGVPKPVAAALRAPRGSPALVAAKAWWLSGKPVLLLLGGVGSGKTTAAAWVLLRQLEREVGVQRPSGGQPVDVAMFATAAEFNGLSDYHPESRAWLERLCHCQLLVLDNLGAERMGDGELSCVQRVIGERHATGRRTVLTSDMSGDAFRSRYGERVVDRIREAGMVKASGQASLRTAGGAT